MKVLRFIIILILILCVGFLALCLFASKEVNVERSTTVNAPKSVVFSQIVKFNNWQHWNPWIEQDSSTKWDVRGTDGEKGSAYHYVGQKIGEGTTINDGVTDGEMKYKLEILKPFPVNAGGYYKVASEGGKTKVTWYYHQDLQFYQRGFMAIMGVGKMLGKTFDRGLELLKTYSEAHADDTAVVGGITDIMYPAHTYAAVRKVVKWTDMHQFFMDCYALLGQQIGPRISGPASALYYNWDEANMQADMAACFPVSSNAPFTGGTIIEVPASAGYKIVYVGPYNNNMKLAHTALQQHVQAAGKTSKLVIEEYIKMPSNETDSNKYETNIIYLVN